MTDIQKTFDNIKYLSLIRTQVLIVLFKPIFSLILIRTQEKIINNTHNITQMAMPSQERIERSSAFLSLFPFRLLFFHHCNNLVKYCIIHNYVPISNICFIIIKIQKATNIIAQYFKMYEEIFVKYIFLGVPFPLPSQNKNISLVSLIILIFDRKQ